MKRIVDPIIRFWSKVKVGDGCWEWSGGKTHNGYGRFSLSPTREMRAHRFSWEITHGNIEDGLVVCHTCDNPPCVRPDHLFVGTIKDNCEDRDKKGRGADRTGSKHHMAKLSDRDIFEIRAMRNSGVPQSSIAKRFGIRQQHVSRISRGENWGHL